MTYAARHLPAHLGPAAWDAILPARVPCPPVSADTTADVAIIGGGFAGLAAARRLTQLQPDAKIVVLEAGHIAEGASGRNSGFMIDLPHDLASNDYAGTGDDRGRIALNRHAQSFAAEAVDDYGIDPTFFDRAGKINGAASKAAEAHNQSYARHLASLGETSEHLDAQAMRQITGSAHYRSGLYTPGTIMLQPAGFIRGMADGLRHRGVHIFERTPALALTQSGPDWQIATLTARITTPRVILTVNGHLESFGIRRDRLLHVFLFATMTPELPADALKALGGQPRWGITPADPMGTTVRRIDTPQGGNRIVTRTCAVLRSGLRATPADLSRAARVMQSKFDSRFPGLAGMKMEYAWAGHLCLTQNAVSVTGEVEPGLFSACAQNGLGTTRGTLTGIAAAELASGETSDITRHFTAEPDPTKLPHRIVRDRGANALLRWKEWKARRD